MIGVFGKHVVKLILLLIIPTAVAFLVIFWCVGVIAEVFGYKLNFWQKLAFTIMLMIILKIPKITIKEESW